MTRAKIALAVIEAKRFMGAAEKVLASGSAKDCNPPVGYSKDTASLKRASLDLTRALAVMRYTTGYER
jgi:hypothetical protein